MTQSAMRMNMAGSRPNQQDAQKRSDQQSSQKRSNQQSSTARSANTPSDVIANAASQTKDEKRGVFASMKQAMAPYVEGHSHTVLYGIVGFVIAALILLAGFWPTVLLVLFAVWPNKRRDALRAPFVGHNCAHRGYFGKDQRPPENSLPAFAAAAQNGYGIELDVQFTSDRRLVVFHDDTLDRMTPAKGFVHDMDWANFSAQPLAGSNEHPPLFADMLRTVAETNPDTPLIVEIKSRAEYSKTYLEELCRATIAELKAYPGPYCIESFDPRVVGIVRRQAPDILRGQLADSYQSYRKDGTHAVPAFAFSHLFGNFLGRPDFIAWCPAKRNWAVKLNAALGAMMVMWTALPEHDTAKLEAENDAVIFQWYAPKQKYRE